MKSESEIQQEIQLEAPRMRVNLMRNNSGAAKDITGRLIRYGLGQVSKNQAYKSSDLIGWTEVVVTPEMVGRTLAVFTAIEVKKEDWKPNYRDTRELHQRNFIEWVKSRGGIAAMINSVDEFKKLFIR